MGSATRIDNAISDFYYLKGIADQRTAAGTATSFFDILLEENSKRAKELDSGKLLTHTAANGREAGFTPIQKPTADQAGNKFGAYIRWYKQAEAGLIAAGTENPTAAQVAAEFEALLLAGAFHVTSCTGDFSTLDYR